VAKEVRQKKEALFGSDRTIDMNLGAIKVARQRVRDVPGNNKDPVRLLDVLLDPQAVVRERDHTGLNAFILINWRDAGVQATQPWNCVLLLIVVVE
jgi:hypothetical protein